MVTSEVILTCTLMICLDVTEDDECNSGVAVKSAALRKARELLDHLVKRNRNLDDYDDLKIIDSGL